MQHHVDETQQTQQSDLILISGSTLILTEPQAALEKTATAATLVLFAAFVDFNLMILKSGAVLL